MIDEMVLLDEARALMKAMLAEIERLEQENAEMSEALHDIRNELLAR